MAITSNAAITMSALRTEYKDGTGPVSMSELNRGGGNFPLGGTRNNTVPTTDNNLAFSKYRNTSKTVVVTYELIGAGGAGGFGVNNNGSPGTYAPSGGSTTLVSTAGTITGAGGAGGENMGGGKGTHGTDGASSAYGLGGTGGGENQSGGSPSAYGAGGGGGGGDDGDTYDVGGRSGFGGGAGTRRTGSMTVNYSTSISLSVGAGGIGPTTGYDGGDGAGGYAGITWDSKSNARTSGSASYTIN